MRKITIIFTITFASITSGLFSAGSYALEASPVSTITRFISYSQIGNGDVVFRIKNPTVGCFGYWMNKADPGFEANLSMALAAFHSKTSVKIQGHEDQKWGGSGNFWCKLYAIEYPE